MQENSFEKQVQQKMDELQFQPSEPVWQKVEAQIRRKKERRRAIFLLLPLLLIGGGMALYFSNGDKESASQKSITIQQTPAATTPDVSISKPVISEAENIPKVSETKTVKKEDQHTTSNASNKKIQQQKENKTFIAQQATTIVTEEAQPNKPLIGKRKKVIPVDELHALVLQNEIVNNNVDEEIVKKEDDKNVSKSFYDSVANKQTIVPTLTEKNAISNATAAITDTTSQLITATVSSDKKDSAETIMEPVVPVTASRQKKNRTWEWTANARIGISGTRTQMSELFTVESAADFYASPIFGNTTSAPAFSSSNTITNGTAFTVGAGVRKKMFQNLFVSAGLQYSQYSSRSYVGMRKEIDTTVSYNGRSNNLESYFTQSGSQSRYTTRFHYIEVPIAFEYRLFKKLPLHLQHGISAGYLFNTNALYYDRNARIFYQNDEWLRKVGFNVFTAVDYRLLQLKNFSLFAGPQLQWGITPIQQKREDKKHHQFFAGLQTRIAF